MGRNTVQLETAVSTISKEYLLEFTSEYDISEDLHPELPGPGERINNRFFWVDERVFPTVADWRISASKDEMPAKNAYSPEAVMVLNTHRTLIQKPPEALLYLVGLSRRYYLGDELYPIFLHDDDRDMDFFNLIRAPNPTKVKTGTRPRAAHEVPLLTASRVIEMEDPAAVTDSSRVPSTIERSPLDFANENPSQQSTRGNGTEDQSQEAVAPEVPPLENVTTTGVAPEVGQAEGIAATGPCVIKERRKRGNDRVDTNAPLKVLRRDHSDSRPTHITLGGKSLAAMGLGMGSTCPVPTLRDAPADVSDPDPLSFADPQSLPTADVASKSSKGAAAAGDPESENTSFTFMFGSPESIYRPEWGVTNGCLLALKACQDLVDHIAPPGYFLELRHLHNDDFLKQYNINLARQVAMRSQLRLRNGRALDALSIDFNEDVYPHMLTAIAGRRWVIEHGLRLAVMKCGESTELRQVFADVVSGGIAKGMSKGLKYGAEHGKANLSLEAIEAYDPEAEAKYIAALHALKDLKYPMVDQLKSLKDASIDVIMASLHLERACKEEIMLADAIAANVSHAEKKMKCRVVCRTHGVGSAHHARSDGVLVSVPTVAPQGLAILLADAATQTETSEDEASPRLLRSSSLHSMHN
nr:hypothetical protein [Tanacetum cinerariifolium]